MKEADSHLSTLIPKPGARWNSKLLRWALIFAVWTVFALLYSAQFHFLGLKLRGLSVPWWQGFLWQMASWSLWAIFTSYVLWLCRRFPMERSFWRRGVPVHLLSCLTLSCIHLIYYAFVSYLISPFGIGFPSPFGNLLLNFFRLWIPMEFLIYGVIGAAGYGFGYYQKYREREGQTSELRALLASSHIREPLPAFSYRILQKNRLLNP